MIKEHICISTQADSCHTMVPTPTRCLGLHMNLTRFKVEVKQSVCVRVHPTDESVLMDLKALLVEAKQKVPPVLQVLQSGDETMLDIGGESFSREIKIASRLSYSLVSFFSICSLFLFCNIHRREGLHILRWSWSSYHRLSKAGGHADQTGHQHRTERLSGS